MGHKSGTSMVRCGFGLHLRPRIWPRKCFALGIDLEHWNNRYTNLLLVLWPSRMDIAG